MVTSKRAESAPTTAPRRHRFRVGVVLGSVALLLAIALGATLAWALRSERGSAWLLQQLPGVRAMGTRGALLGGDFEAEQIEVALSGGSRLTLTSAGWRGLRVERAGGTLWLRVHIDRLYAARVGLSASTEPSTSPLQAPTDLALPIELQVDALQVQTLQIAALGAQPLRDLDARLHLGADDGNQHRVDLLGLAFDRLRAQGNLQIGTRASLPLSLSLQLGLTQPTPIANAQWSASATLQGPLAMPRLQATVRAQPATSATGAPKAPATPQTLDLTAALRPFEAWPLGDLDARAQALDLSAFHADAPRTALSGQAQVRSSGMGQQAVVLAQLTNADAGLWNESRLPLRQLTLDLRGRPDDPGTLDVQRLVAELGTRAKAAGRIDGQGGTQRSGWQLALTLSGLQPALLDARAPEMTLSGPLRLSGSLPDAAQPNDLQVDARGELLGQSTLRGAARAVQLRLDAGWSRKAGVQRIELREALATAGSARATASGNAQQADAAAAWLARGQAALKDFDPAPWWPGREDSPWRRGPHRLNASAQFDLAIPATPAAQIDRWRGRAAVKLNDSVLAGVPLRGEASLRSAEGSPASVLLDLDAAGNRVHAEARLATRAGAVDDHWDATLTAPALAALTPVWQLLRPAGSGAQLAGAINGTLQVDGRWPALDSSGQLQADGLRIDTLVVQRGEARWRVGTRAEAPVEAQVKLGSAAIGPATFDSAELQLQGTGRDHRLSLRADSKTQPPTWAAGLQGGPAGAGNDAGKGARSEPRPNTVARVTASGGLFDANGALAGWRGTLAQIELRPASENAPPWLNSRDIGFEIQWGPANTTEPLQFTLQPGRAEALGAALRWQRIHWRAADAQGAPARIEAQAELEPLSVAPLLQRLQPDFGWGGDLQIAGKLDIRSAPTFRADVVLERHRGDLSVTDETGTQSLGLSTLRLGLNAENGTWSFTQGLAGSTLGVAAGAVVARTTPEATWPAPETPVSGVLELQVANLGTWGTWVPAGWRLGGALRVGAAIGGSFGALEYTGDLSGRALSVRNFLQGVNVTDGDVEIALQGNRARIERFSARAGSGTVRLSGEAALGVAPQAQLALVADKFQLLGRVDRRIVASGQARLKLDRDALALDGQFGVDEGLIDFTRGDAPTLSSDVTVLRPGAARPTRPADEPAEPAEPASATPARGAIALPQAALDLRVNLGERLRLKGRGLDTGLRGELHITSPGGRLAVNGTVNTADGTYEAYGQKLVIDRGELVFNGPADNPRLNIEATRPNLDVRAGVSVTGSAVNPRIRLFSEPELSEIDKLSWLVLGRASDGLGRTDTALLQRAALALLSGEGEGVTDQFTRAIGLDEVSLRQSEGEVRETIVTLGKQLSRRWYVGYERSLNATAGTWQLIYRVAQRFTLRAQSGADNSVDVIWTWRWQ